MTFGNVRSFLVESLPPHSPGDWERDHLLRLCGQIQECIPNDEFHELLHELYTRSMRYLEREEKLLRSLRDPGLQEHRAAHDAFHESFLSLMLDASAGRASPFAVGDHALRWWQTHLDSVTPHHSL